MDIRAKILENVRNQAIVNERLRALHEEAERLSGNLQRLGGQVDLLSEWLKEETGHDLNELIQNDEGFKTQVQEANKSGAKIAQGTVQSPQIQPDAPKGTTRSGNKKVGKSTEKEAEESHSRISMMPKIVVTDGPPSGDLEEVNFDDDDTD